MDLSAEVRCASCQRAFEPHPGEVWARQFCRSACRRAYAGAMRQWVRAGLSRGEFGVDAVVLAGAVARALRWGAERPPPLIDEEFAASARQPAAAMGLIDELAIALGELGDEELRVVVQLFPAALIGRLYAWLDGQG